MQQKAGENKRVRNGKTVRLSIDKWTAERAIGRVKKNNINLYLRAAIVAGLDILDGLEPQNPLPATANIQWQDSRAVFLHLPNELVKRIDECEREGSRSGKALSLVHQAIQSFKDESPPTSKVPQIRDYILRHQKDYDSQTSRHHASKRNVGKPIFFRLTPFLIETLDLETELNGQLVKAPDAAEKISNWVLKGLDIAQLRVRRPYPTEGEEHKKCESKVHQLTVDAETLPKLAAIQGSQEYEAQLVMSLLWTAIDYANQASLP